MASKLIRDEAEAAKLVGRKVKVINSVGNHRIPLNEYVTLTGYYNNGGGTGYVFYHDYLGGTSGTVLRGTNFQLDPETKEQIESDLKELRSKFKEQESELKMKLDYLKETGAKEFDEMEFKAYKTLTIIDDSRTTKSQKAKLIADLIK